ncbi:MAG TPA: EamA family transporter, partial [Burkholderiales bacterium]|nr:EamA family transporter [Burkholderiales bacterium]
ASIVMAILVLVWGYAWVLAKMALRYCGPLDVATLRTAVGAVCLFPALLLTSTRIVPEHPWEALGVGVVQTALFLLLNNWALSQGEAGKTSVLVFTMPFWVLVFAWPVLGERIQGWGWFAVTLAAIGLAMILEPWGLRTTLLAKTLAVLAGVCWALGVVISKRLQNRHPVNVYNFTFWQMALGLLPMLVVSLATHSREIDWSWQFIVILMLLGAVATAGGWIAWFYVLNRLPAGTTSMSSLGIPVIALLGSSIQLGERPTRAEWVGIALIAVALGIVSWDTMRRNRPVEPLMGQE